MVRDCGDNEGALNTFLRYYLHYCRLKKGGSRIKWIEDTLYSE